MAAPALVQKLWNYCNTLRDHGLVADLQAALEQFAAIEEDLKEYTRALLAADIPSARTTAHR